MSEYIKKEDVLVYLEKWKIGHIEDKEHYPINYGTLLDMMFFIRRLPTYSIPETAKPEEGAELIDRRQIKWYGCDHEGRIKGINCDTADCSKCFYATVEHDEVMSLPVYRIPDSDENTGEWIYAEDRPEGFCSKCDKDIAEASTPYCPYCGAKMTWVGAIREPYKKGE